MFTSRSWELRSGQGAMVSRVRPTADPALSGDCRRVLPSQEDSQVFPPGPDLRVVRAREAGVDLADVIEIVDRPGREQLPQGHLAEGRMQTAPVEVCVGDQLAKRGQVGVTE